MESIALLFMWGFSRPADWERDRFPSAGQCEAALKFNLAHHDHLRAARSFYGTEHQFWVAWCNVWNADGWRWYNEAMSETWALRQPWWMLEQSWSQKDRVSRWLALVNLRREIGWNAFYEGRMPPPVPVWRFREIQWE